MIFEVQIQWFLYSWYSFTVVRKRCWNLKLRSYNFLVTISFIDIFVSGSMLDSFRILLNEWRHLYPYWRFIMCVLLWMLIYIPYLVVLSEKGWFSLVVVQAIFFYWRVGGYSLECGEVERWWLIKVLGGCEEKVVVLRCCGLWGECLRGIIYDWKEWDKIIYWWFWSILTLNKKITAYFISLIYFLISLWLFRGEKRTISKLKFKYQL